MGLRCLWRVCQTHVRTSGKMIGLSGGLWFVLTANKFIAGGLYSLRITLKVG
jgi:hypothetical protein